MTRLLDVQDLSVRFKTKQRDVIAVNKVSFSLSENEVLGVVGESGSGKSQLMLSLLGLQPDNAIITGQAIYNDQDLLAMNNRQLSQVRCNDIAMIFQDPMSALNPYMRIEQQLTESLTRLQGISKTQASRDALDMLTKVRIPEPEKYLKSFPYQLSGGMRQRVMIAMALLRKPKILIADEPTTALDVTVQAEILSLIKSLREEFSLSVILITHDMSIVAGQCDRVMVMYAGQLVESATTDKLFYSAKHPYTQGLLLAAKSQTGLTETLYSIPGQPPDDVQTIQGCVFNERCEQRLAVCSDTVPALTGNETQQQACHLYSEPT